jgi:uncharacterized protein YoxC
MSDLTATNTWLGILTTISIVQFLAMTALAVMAFRLYRRTRALVDRAEAEYIAPLSAKVQAVAEEARDVVRKVERLEDRVRGMVDRVEGVAGHVGSVAQHAWPVLGTWRAVTAAVSSLAGGSGSRKVA